MDVTLSTGKVLPVDLSKITIKEYRALFDKDQRREDEDATLAKCFGITVDELLELSQPDYRRAAAAFFEAAREPLEDPKA